jgi:hypothetical protein
VTVPVSRYGPLMASWLLVEAAGPGVWVYGPPGVNGDLQPVGKITTHPDGGRSYVEQGDDRYGVTALCLTHLDPDAVTLAYQLDGWEDPASEADGARVRCEHEIARRSRVMATPPPK